MENEHLIPFFSWSSYSPHLFSLIQEFWGANRLMFTRRSHRMILKTSTESQIGDLCFHFTELSKAAPRKGLESVMAMILMSKMILFTFEFKI